MNGYAQEMRVCDTGTMNYAPTRIKLHVNKNYQRCLTVNDHLSTCIVVIGQSNMQRSVLLVGSQHNSFQCIPAFTITLKCTQNKQKKVNLNKERKTMYIHVQCKLLLKGLL